MVLNNVAAPDAYGPTATIERRGLRSVRIQVANQPIVYQLAADEPGGAWGDEEQLLPAIYTFPVVAGGIRFRAASPGLAIPARVTLRAEQTG